MYLSYLLVLTGTCLCSVSASETADNHNLIPTQSYQFNHLSIKEGLLDNDVLDILQDRAGFVWLGTSQGLIKYDGLSHINFHHNVKKPSSLSSNEISSLFEDSQGQLWVGTENGLNRQLDHSNQFQRYLHDPNQPNSLTENVIVDIIEDNNQSIWVATSNAIHKHQSSSDDFIRYAFYDSNTGTNARINILFVSGESLFVGTSIGLYRYQAEDDRFFRYSNLNGLPANIYNVLSASHDHNGSLWIGIENQGIYKSSKDNLQFSIDVTANSYLRNVDNEQFPVLSSIHNPKHSDRLWLGTQNHGLFSYQPASGKFEKINQSNSDHYTRFENAQILDIFQDKSGLIWITTELSGIFQWSSHTLNIQHIGANSGYTDERLLSSYVWYFHETPDKKIWLGTQRGIFSFYPATQQYEQILIDNRPYEEQPQVYWMDSVGETMWLASETEILKYDYQNNTITKRISPTGLTGVIYAISITDTHIFIAVNEQGILAFDRKTHQPTDLAITFDGPESDLVSRPVGIFKDLDSSLWILTREGLVNFDPIDDRVRLSLKSAVDGLSGNRVSAFTQEDKSTYWIGTTGNGINRLEIEDIEQGKYQVFQYDHNPKLANLVVNGLLVDNNDPRHLWISTHSGLLYIDPETEYSRDFQLNEGMQSREFNEGAYLKDSAGFLYFGGTNGFNRIEPVEFTRSDFEPELRLTAFTVSCGSEQEHCQQVNQRFRQFLHCEQYYSNCQSIDDKLPSDIENLYISFASLDYTLPDINRYRYRIKTSEQTPWTEINNVNELTLSGLGSGKYHIEIQGTNFAGEWSSSIAELKFTVDKPWYLENYTLFILALTFLSTIYYFRESTRLKKLEKAHIKRAIRKNEENFKFALWGSGDEIIDWNVAEGVLKRTNPIKQIKSGNEDKAFTTESMFKLIHPDDYERIREEILAAFKGEIPYIESSFRFRSKGGGYIWVLARARVVERNPQDKSALRVLGSIKDITLMKATEDKLNLIAQAFENTKDGISVIDSNFKAVFNNKAFYEITGLDHIEAINKQYFFSPESDNNEMLDQVKVALNNFGEWEGEIWERRHNGEEFAISLKIAIVQDAPDTEQYYICVFSDITYRKRSEEELIKLANIDSLTGLPNRSLFLDRLSHAIAYSRRNKTLFALLFIDLDNFKNVNDTLGHTIGDKMLVNIAKRLKGCVRDVDTVARLGGDEFTVLLENIKTTNEVGVCANKILARLAEPMEIEAIHLKTTPSIGIGMYPAHGNDQETILKNADLAMYSAKEKGKNNYQFFTEDMTSLAHERINIENKLRDAIDNDQLTLYYQPKVFSVTGEIVGFEALIRWIHPEDGMISPGAFIPVAEETGLILSLGDWIIEEAIQQAKLWSEINPNGAQIAVNISAKQFMSEYLPDRIAELLEKYDLHPKYLELEITEGTLMENMHHTIQALKRLRDMGLVISLDDFGTGYSSLSYLKEFPVNKLKIDQSFVRDITTDPSDASIVASIITLAHNLGLNVVAEGCETIEQLKFIRSYHCEQVQGYLFSRPLPKAEAEELLRLGIINVEE